MAILVTSHLPIFHAQAVDVNSANTDVATIPIPFAKYRVTRISIYEASTSLGASGATTGVFTAAAGGGTTVVTAATMTALTSAAVVADRTIAASATYLTAANLFVRCGTAHGSAATISISIEVQPLV